MGSARAARQHDRLQLFPRRCGVPAEPAGRRPARQCARAGLHIRHASAERGAGQAATYAAASQGQPVRVTASGSAPGLRLEWTSEIAGHGLEGDAEFDRHILNARGYIPIWRRGRCCRVRGLFGFSNGTLPVERRFAHWRHRHRCTATASRKSSGTGMTLLNAEYRVNLTSADRRPRRRERVRLLRRGPRQLAAPRSARADRRSDRRAGTGCTASASAPALAACASSSASAPTTSRDRARFWCGSRRRSDGQRCCAPPCLLVPSSRSASRRPRRALETRITEMRVAGGSIRASLEIRDMFPAKFQAVLEEGAAIHLRLQIELWEDRPVWDKLRAARRRGGLPHRARSRDAAGDGRRPLWRGQPTAGVAGAADAASGSRPRRRARRTARGTTSASWRRSGRSPRRRPSRRARRCSATTTASVSLAGDGEDALSRGAAGERLPAERVVGERGPATSPDATSRPG